MASGGYIGTPYSPTLADLSPPGGATFIAWLDVVWGSICFSCMRTQHPDNAGEFGSGGPNEPWIFTSPAYDIPVAGEQSRAVAVAATQSAYKCFVATTKHVLEFTVDVRATDPALWQLPPHVLTVMQLPPPVPQWSNYQVLIGKGKPNVDIWTIKLDPDTGVLGVLFRYGTSSIGYAAIQVSSATGPAKVAAGYNYSANIGGFDGVSAGVLLFEVYDLPPVTFIQDGSKQKPGPTLSYQTHGVGEDGEFDNSGAYCNVDLGSGAWEVFGDGYEIMVSENRKNADGTPYTFNGEPPWYNHTIDPDSYSAYTPSGSTTWDLSDNGIYKYGPSRIKLGGATAGRTVQLADFLRWAGEASGYPAANITVTGLADVLVYGAALTADTDLEGMLDGLSVVYDFDFYNGGDYLRIIASDESGGDNVTLAATYDVSQLLPIAPDRTITTKRLPPDKVAGSVSITYLDYAADFAQMTQSYTRDTFPIPSNVGEGISQSITVPIVMDAGDAATAALRATYRAGARNITNEFMTPWLGISHEPTDVVKLIIGAYEYLVQLNECTINGDLSVSFGGTNYAARFKGTVDVIPPGAPPIDSSELTRSRVVLIDAPSVVRGEAITYLKAYAMLIPARAGGTWKGAVAFRSINGEVPENIGPTTKAAPHMIVAGVPVAGQETLFTDRESVLTVRLGAGDAPAACSEDAMRGGTNYALYGDTGRWEFVSFANVEQVDAETFKLSTILRGQNGTEMNVNRHLAGDLLIPLKTFQAFEIDYAPSDIGTDLVVIASNTGAQQAGDTDKASVILTGASQKPFAPTRASYAVNGGGDAVISWERRDRAYVEMPDDGPDTVPLSEAFEAYEIDVYSPAGAVARTITVTAPMCAYTAADIAADGNSTAAGFRVAIYQMSALVGRGFALDRVIYAV